MEMFGLFSGRGLSFIAKDERAAKLRLVVSSGEIKKINVLIERVSPDHPDKEGGLWTVASCEEEQNTYRVWPTLLHVKCESYDLYKFAIQSGKVYFAKVSYEEIA